MGKKNKALFLDRDGVINVDKHHVYKIEDCEFVPGIFDLCRQAKQKGYLLVVVTNQAGIAKGIYTEEEYFLFRDYVHAEFARQNCPIDAEYYCPYHPQGKGPYAKVSDWRKPAPGMILQAEQDWDIDLAQSILIGDKGSDIQAGQAAGLKRCILVQNGQRVSAEDVWEGIE
ncbi:D-glycero-alpha-D-manno-heptose-1,7-bisphosphate 7-phosphatase [Candidatus Avelusimicrobium fimicolum]|uniref:D-glycero-alpha-D-manno-heptose-1,7-bisphosphate 7-phosphatase n=1 Tax=Candidatus Avelusimicrobium fimicolum TaxID=3416216 RepID=UPI003D0F0BF5